MAEANFHMKLQPVEPRHNIEVLLLVQSSSILMALRMPDGLDERMLDPPLQ